MNIIKDVISFWKETWAESKFLFFLEAIGSVASMTAAVLLSTIMNPPMVTIFICYLIGSIALLYVSYVRHSSWMLIMFLYFSVFNLIGLYNHLMV